MRNFQSSGFCGTATTKARYWFPSRSTRIHYTDSRPIYIKKLPLGTESTGSVSIRAHLVAGLNHTGHLTASNKNNMLQTQTEPVEGMRARTQVTKGWCEQ